MACMAHLVLLVHIMDTGMGIIMVMAGIDN
jgi:hypothetical protein